jgi:putative acetyltransferase
MPEVLLELTRADRPETVTLIKELDDYLLRLYPRENTHLLNVQALIQPNIRFYMATYDQQVVGCGALRLETDYAEVKRMYVRSTYRGLGIGYRLLGNLENVARDMGYKLLRLETGVYQTEAMKLYERCGFQRCKAFGEYMDTPLNLCYEKRLS